MFQGLFAENNLSNMLYIHMFQTNSSCYTNQSMNGEEETNSERTE
jgi:hypothetical protein